MENEFQPQDQESQKPAFAVENQPLNEEAIASQQPQVTNEQPQQNPQNVFYGQQSEMPRYNPEGFNSGNYQQPYQSAPQPQYSSEYRWVRPEPVYQQPVKKKKQKKGWTTGRVVALMLCCSLIGGAIGAGVIAMLNGTAKRPGASGGSSVVMEGERPSTTIDINKIETGTLMSAAEVYAANVNSTVGITTAVTTNFWGYQTTSAASGSGFIYSNDGYIITNFHVIEDSTAITVSLYDGRELDAELIGYDESNDIAVLKVEAENLSPVVLGDSNNLNVGDPVVAIGNPLGELTFSLTAGTVSALEREVTFSGGVTMNLIQTDCAINSGNSGGALFNLYGEVIGITNAKYSGNSNSGATIDNIGFAIPLNSVRGIVDSIIEKGYIVKPYIGVTITDVSTETQSYGLPQGAAIRGVETDSPAEKAGLQANDIVTAIDGQEITGAADLKSYVSETAPGEVLKLTVWRKGAVIELELTVGEQIQSGVTQQEPEVEPTYDQESGGFYDFPFFGWGY